MPMSASLSASASLTPSPVIATTWPFDCSAATIARFCCGVTRPNTRVGFQHLGHLVEVVRELARVVSVAGVGESDPLGDRGDGAGLSPEITRSATPCSAK